MKDTDAKKVVAAAVITLTTAKDAWDLGEKAVTDNAAALKAALDPVIVLRKAADAAKVTLDLEIVKIDKELKSKKTEQAKLGKLQGELRALRGICMKAKYDAFRGTFFAAR